MFKDLLKENLQISLSEAQERLFERYLEILLETNKTMNLTAITDPKEVYIKHFYDSLLLMRSADFGGPVSICDMGSGAGFPGIPIKIVCPDVKLTLIDSLTKRIRFLESLVKDLKMTDVVIINDRIEVAAKTLQQAFDVVTARALGAMPLILEMGLPMVKKGGVMIAMKGAKGEEELASANHALTVLGGRLDHIKKHVLPDHMGERTNIVIRKRTHIEGYPRPYAHMRKSPL
ncbi:MAG: 16S rRNA (guanine(527)-N(7))-methyltransferase RsmG [Acholeplasmataceae bacterium]|nr:16S rRNA (guanine(527)-N(7))-methyltransferase RsmG [Acholeplasmataceae bacterium]